MKKTFIILCILALIPLSTAYGDIAELEHESLSSSVWLGYRMIDYIDSKRAEEFEYFENSVIGGLEYRTFTLPHRLHLEFDLENQYDYFGDLSYAYQDFILLRAIHRNTFHNWTNIELDPTGTNTATVRWDSASDIYDTRTGITDVSLRLKAPDYPVHLFASAHLVSKEGTKQQIFAGDQVFRGNVDRNSEERDIDWKTQEYKVGVNGHINWIEAEYIYGQKTFTAGGDATMVYAYPLPSPGAPIRNIAGDFPHNVIPDTKGTSHTVRVHTNYTGKLVATGSLSTKNRESDYSGAKADYVTGTTAITWMPITKLTMFLKYKYDKKDIENPDTVTIADVNVPANTYTDPAVRDSISSTTSRVSLTARYRPSKIATIRANITHETRTREEEEQWHIVPDSTQMNSFYLSADASPVKSMKFKLKYGHESYTDPGYNIIPDSSQALKASMSWLIHPNVSALLSYSGKWQDRKDLLYYDGSVNTSINNREVGSNLYFGNISFLIVNDTSLTLSYAHLNSEIEEDLFFHDGGGAPTWDENTPYKEIATNVAATLEKRMTDRLELSTGVAYTHSQASFEVDHANLVNGTATVEPVSQYSETELKEIVYSIGASYRIMKDLIIDGYYKYVDFNDVDDNIWDDVEDGTAQTFFVKLTKKWG
ncbi:MAG: MtrB/PioB family outer membrane beta-barrel protein [Nitrospirota bacterium]|nr:MAG: MtrB/PioB family outer membrane beta-barrel protein [Nitrospirota bacterium]